MNTAIDEVIVQDVHEVHNCAGVKSIWISAQRGEDEHYSQQFRLNTSWIFPEQKLQLATVLPGDVVKVVFNYFAGNLEVAGDFVSILNPLGQRVAYCQCLYTLVSDGYKLVCPNQLCSLTEAAKFERLSHLKFVPEDEDRFFPPQFDHANNVTNWGDERYNRPFGSLIYGEYWGRPGGLLPLILENDLPNPVNVQTFLVEAEFNEWIIQTPFLNNALRFRSMVPIGRFHGAMEELILRRDTSVSRQNLLMAQWLLALGIESLSTETIDRLVYHEKNYEDSLEPMLFYAWMITHSKELIGEMNIDRYEAQALCREIKLRRLELFDLFKHFCSPPGASDLSRCFEEVG